MLTQTESRTSNLTDLITGDSLAKITDFLKEVPCKLIFRIFTYKIAAKN